MTDSPGEQKKSRRGLLALVGAGGAAAVAALLGRGNGAEAAQYVWNSSDSDATGYFGNSGLGRGVKAEASGGASHGVQGISWGQNGRGVHGTAANDGGIGVYGHGAVIGTFGTSNGAGVKGEGKPGVWGQCFLSNGSGVKGEGNAPGTIGVFAKNAPSRKALVTEGRVKMDCARAKTLSAKSTKVTLPTGVRAGTNAVVLATTQGNPGNDAVIWRAYRVDSTHIRIVFNKAPAKPVSVAYWVVHTG